MCIYSIYAHSPFSFSTLVISVACLCKILVVQIPSGMQHLDNVDPKLMQHHAASTLGRHCTNFIRPPAGVGLRMIMM